MENNFDYIKTGAVLAKLRRVQTELHAPKGQKNDFGGYKYRSCEDILEAVKPLLAAQDLTLMISDGIEFIEGRFYVKAHASVIDPESGGAVAVTAYAREVEDKKGMDASQVTGSASSYARKLSLCGLFAISGGDDADATNVKKCADCGKVIGSHGKTTGAQIADGTLKTYGRALCYDCAAKAKAAAETEKKGAGNNAE